MIDSLRRIMFIPETVTQNDGVSTQMRPLSILLSVTVDARITGTERLGAGSISPVGVTQQAERFSVLTPLRVEGERVPVNEEHAHHAATG